MRRRMLLTAAVALMMAMVPGIAAAHTSGAVAETGGAVISLPAFGAGLSIEVALDEFGNISEVGIDSADAPDPEPSGEEEAAAMAAHQVRFSDDELGVRIDVKAKNNKLQMSVKADDPANLVGDTTWTADLFGTGEPTTVTATIVAGAGGSLEIAGLAWTGGPADMTVTPVTPGDDDEDADEASSQARLVFERDGMQKTLKVTVSTDDDEDGDEAGDGATAKIRFELMAKDRQRLRQSLADLVGERSWDGLLCDGTQVVVTYRINDDGTVEALTLPEAADVRSHPQMFDVRFDGSKLRLKVQLVEVDEGWMLKVDSKADKCKHHEDTNVRDKKSKGDRNHEKVDDEQDDD